SPREGLSELVISPGDVLRLCVRSPTAESGSLPLGEGLNLCRGGRDRLLAAACSAHQPQPFFGRRGFAQAREFLRSCRLGQTERDSYAISLIAPISPELSPPLLRDEDDLSGVPYERRVTLLLMLGLR